MRKKRGMRILAALMACAVFAASADTGGFAVYAGEPDPVRGVTDGGASVVVEEQHYTSGQVEEIAETMFGAGSVALIDGTAEKYIDRVQLSNDVKYVYDALVNGSLEGEILVNPVTDLNLFPAEDGSRYYVLNPAVSAVSETEAEQKEKELVTVYAAFLRDHPEVFWLTGEITTLRLGDGSTYQVYLVLCHTDDPNGTNSDVRDLVSFPDALDTPAADAITDVIKQRDSYIEQIQSAMREEMGEAPTDLEKMTFFHNWLTHNNVYNSDDAAATDDPMYRLAHQSISALQPVGEDQEKLGERTRPVCEGYAKAFKVLCDAEKIPCVLINGNGIASDGTSGNHMWNAVQLENAWYAVDVTWDDPVVEGHENEYVSGKEGSSYFLVGSDTEIEDRKFCVSHEMTNEVVSGEVTFTNGPTLSTSAYALPPFRTVTVKVGTQSYDSNQTYRMAYQTTSPLSFVVSAIGYDGNALDNSKLTCVWKEGDTELLSGAGETGWTVPAGAKTGTHTLQLTVSAKKTDASLYSQNTTIQFTVDKGTPSVTAIADKTATYGQTLGDFTLTTATGDTPGSWSWDEGDTAPVGAVGTQTHKVTFQPSDAESYEKKTQDVTFTVNKATPTIAFGTNYVNARAYIPGEAFPLPTETQMSLKTLSYSEVQWTWYEGSTTSGTVLSQAPEAVGTYTLQASFAGDSNRNAAAAVTKEVTISNESTRITVPTDSFTKEYGEPAFSLGEITNNVGAAMTYESADPAIAAVDNSGMVTIKGVGATKITVRVAGNPGKWDAAEKEISITVNKKLIKVKIQDAGMYKGDGTFPEFSLEDYKNSLASGDTPGEGITGTITWQVYDGSTEITDPSGIAAGTYTIKATCTGSDKYDVTCKEATLTVSADKGAITRDTSQELTKEYDGKPFALSVTTNTGQTPSAFYRKADASDMTVFSQTGYPQDAGTYDIRLATTANTYFTAAELIVRNVTITPYDLTAHASDVTITLPAALTYDGTEKRIALVEGSVKANLAGTETNLATSDYDLSGDRTATDAGTYTITITGKGNYTGSKSADYTIQKADGLNPPDNTRSVGYDKLNKTLGDVSLPDGWSWEDPTQLLTAGGTVTGIAVYQKDARNYNTVSVGVTMDPKTKLTTRLTAERFSYTKAYGDEPFLLEVSNAIGAPMTYASDNEAVASVDETGLVRINGVGTANLTTSVSDTEDYTADTLSVKITVKKQTGSIVAEVAESAKEYDGMPFAVDVTKNSDAELQVSYKPVGAEDSEYETGYPKEVGCWIIRFCTAETKLCTAAEETVDVQITACDIAAHAVVVTGIPANLVYNGEEQTVDGVKASITLGGQIYTLKSGEYTISGNTQRDAGSYTLTVQGIGNFTGQAPAEYVIQKASGAKGPDKTITVNYKKDQKVKDVPLNTGWSWRTADAQKALTEGGTVTAAAVYQNDEKNYETVTVTIRMNTCQHTGGTVVNGQKAASCTEAGYTGDTVCRICGRVIQAGSVIPALGHSYTSVVTKEPTEDEEGIRTYTCSRCQHSYTEVIAKLPEPEINGIWEYDNGRWWFRNDDGSYPVNGWEKIGRYWYVFDENGYMRTGWYPGNGAWYYLGGDGAMKTGWINDNGTWYYMESGGAMSVGWRQIDDLWYYMDGSGAMATGWKQIDGVWYYLNPGGAMEIGWINQGGTWYYLEDGGAMAVGWRQIDDLWYYMDGSGAMAIGWKQIGGVWYYLNANGAMAADLDVDGYHLGADGAMQERQ